MGVDSLVADLRYGESSGSPPVGVTGEPLIAVVIPVYKQPQFLKDAVISAVCQAFRRHTKVVIVNDGCPYPSTDWLGRYFGDAFPGEVFYLKKRNGGLSSARNYGARFALAAWPSIQAVFPLDSDNKLSEFTLRDLWRVLSTSPSDVGWIYQDVAYFGLEESVWRTGLPFSVYRLLHENYCEAGGLIRRQVFDAGVWYDEGMKSGFEDWEFYINASLRGFRGAHLPETGFLYRRRGHSMLKDAEGKRDAIISYIREKHWRGFRHDSLTRLEHTEMPRYAFLAPDTGEVRYFSDAAHEDGPKRTVAGFVDALVAWEGEPPPKVTYVPPIVLFARKDVFDFLIRLRVLPGLLFNLQESLSRADCVSVTLDLADNPFLMEIGSQAGAAEPYLLAMSCRRLVELADTAGSRAGRTLDALWPLARENVGLKLGAAFLQSAPAGLLERRSGNHRTELQDAVGEVVSQAHLGLGRISRSWPQNDKDVVAASHTGFAAWKHIDIGASTFPWCSRSGNVARSLTDLFFLLPWFGLGGVEQCVLNLAQALASLDRGYGRHLVLSDSNRLEADPRWLDAFDTITWLPGGLANRKQALANVLCGADVVIDAHSMAGYELLSELKARSRAKFISYLHVVDLDPDGMPYGYPLIASRQYEYLIDHFMVISHQMERRCLNAGVPEEKILVVPNAPAVSPESREAALDIAREKCRRRYSAKKPIKVLFAGRFGPQKGVDRLERIAACLTELGVPFELQLVGKPVLVKSTASVAAPNTRIMPAVVDKRALAGYYTDADVFLLPSRWEGVPLAVLEAMAFGNVVIATNVGAVSEVVEHGQNGVLVDASQSDEALAAAIGDIIADVFRNPSRYDSLRVNACDKATTYSWAQSAERLADLIDGIAD